MQFLKYPNIPGERIKLCAISSEFPEIRAALQKRDIEVIGVEPLITLQNPVRSHADMQLHDLGQGRAVVAGGAEKLKADLNGYGFTINEQEINGKYPHDIALNCFYLNGKLFCREKNTSKILLNYYQSIGAGIARIQQGYVKCSSAIVDSKSIITADASIAKAAESHGIDCLYIHSGGILLPGYDTGFIGGCCGLISGTELAFTGKTSCHRDSGAIYSFCNSRGVDIIELTDSELIDIGGILPLAI